MPWQKPSWLSRPSAAAEMPGHLLGACRPEGLALGSEGILRRPPSLIRCGMHEGLPGAAGSGSKGTDHCCAPFGPLVLSTIPGRDLPNSTTSTAPQMLGATIPPGGAQ